MSLSQGPGSNIGNRFSGNFAAPGFDDIVQQTLRQYQTKSSQRSPDLDAPPEESIHFKQQPLNGSKGDTCKRQEGASALDSIVQNSILQYQDLAAKRSSHFDPNTHQDSKPVGDSTLENIYRIDTSPEQAPLSQNLATERSTQQVSSDSDIAICESSVKRQMSPQTERGQRSKFFKTAAGARKAPSGAQTISDTASSISGATLSDTGSATSFGKALKPDPSAPSNATSLPATAKKSSAKSKGNSTDKQNELGRRRALSRISSSRSREREKQRLDYWRGEKEQLEQSSEKLKKENELLKELISKIKADISLRTIQSALVANLTGAVFK
jgi:hypothetical protein